MSNKNKKKKGTLTPKQEEFAFLVGYKKKTYSQSYREAYKPPATKKDSSIWEAGSRIANNSKVSSRIDEYREQRLKEERRGFSWSNSEAEKELRAIITKNKNDLIRAEKKGKSVRHTTNDSIIKAIDMLNQMGYRIEDEENDLAVRKAKAETELAEEKIRMLKEANGEDGGGTIYNITI
ncbi:MAG: terminase small subunit [Caudoviricetes sp.]|nr:MAG: terminase small subunit [Caudoviricetes sp.]